MRTGWSALFAFGGIYAAGTFGWGTIQIGMFGILLTITGTLGAWLGGKLDDRIGPKPVILGSLAMLILAAIAILSTGRDHDPVRDRGDAAGCRGRALCRGTAEKFFVCIGLFIGFVAGPLQAASRTLLVRLAPPGQITAVLRAVRAVRQGDVVPRAVAGRHRHRRDPRASAPAWRCWWCSSASGALLAERRVT